MLMAHSMCMRTSTRSTHWMTPWNLMLDDSLEVQTDWVKVIMIAVAAQKIHDCI